MVFQVGLSIIPLPEMCLKGLIVCMSMHFYPGRPPIFNWILKSILDLTNSKNHCLNYSDSLACIPNFINFSFWHT